MEAENEKPSQPSRCHMDGVQQANRIGWNKKRKLQADELDFPRPKHKYCWARRFFSEHGSKSDDKLMVKSETYGLASAMLDDDTSEPRSSRGSNSFSEDSDTAISVNEESELLIDCAKPYLYGRPSYDDDDIEV